MYYFGYCTFLSTEEVDKYLPNSEVITKATAYNHKISFCGMEDNNKRGWCHLVDTVEAKGEITIGLVIKHDPKHFVDYPGFERCFLTVYGEDGETYDCWTLRMTNPIGEIKPPKDYWAYIDHGLLTQNLPEEYVNKIKQIYEKSDECQVEE